VTQDYKNQRDLLAQALGTVLAVLGVVNDEPLTGPQLLMAADEYCASKGRKIDYGEPKITEVPSQGGLIVMTVDGRKP
jgi:hypothetical protein